MAIVKPNCHFSLPSYCRLISLTEAAMTPWIHLHRRKLALIFALLACTLAFNLTFGDSKALQQIDWMDVFGEGGSALAFAVWIMLILGSRPAGRVTDLLTLGLGFMLLAFWQDTLDEFIRLPDELWWDHTLESISMPVGIALLTYGLFHWHREQISINTQLNKREKIFRDHRLIDRLTQLGRDDYLIQQFNLPEQNTNDALLMVQLDDFAALSRTYSHTVLDRLLSDLSDVLLANLHSDDLLCRYAGERFAIVLRNTSRDYAQTLADELQHAVQHTAFKPDANSRQRLHLSLQTAIAFRENDSASALVKKANERLNANMSAHGTHPEAA